MVSCSVFGCSNRSRASVKKPGVTFHKFPVNPERRALWIQAIRRTNWQPSPHARICSVHFKEEDIDKTSLSCVRIREQAVPSIFLEVPSKKVLRAAPYEKEASAIEPCTDENSMKPDMIPSTSRRDSINEVVPMEVDEPSVSGNTPPKYRDLLAKKESLIEEKDKIIARYNRRLANKERCIARIRQRSYRAKKKVANLKNVLKELKEKLNIAEESCMMLEGISETSYFLVRRQIQKVKGKRLTRKYNEKLRSFALALHYISPRAYEYVRQQFDTCLPHAKTLARWYKTVDAEPGFCSEAFNAIKAYVSANDGPILTSLMVDSMSIKQDVKWDGTKHVGYVNFGVDLNDDSIPHAKEALVFLINCINGCWKYPIAYFFVAGISGEQLAGLVRQCLTFLHETGVIVCSLTFDGAAANLSMATNLGCSFDPENLKSYFVHPETGEKVHVFLDPCHMLKLVRNTFGERDLVSNDGAVSWKFVNNLYELQDAEGLRLANKLTKGHINWKDQKMKVKLAAQTLSESVAKAIEFCRQLGINSFAGSEATCHFIENFNKLFDILNSKSMKAFGTKKALHENNFGRNKEFFNEMTSYILNLKNVDGGRLCKSNRKVGFIGFLVCMNSSIGMYEDHLLKRKELIFLPLYKVSQDHLELLFSKIRSKGGWNNNPTAAQFVSALKKIIVATELSDLRSGNCIPLESVGILHASSSSAPSSNPMMNINLTTDRIRSLSDEYEPDPLFDHNYFSVPEGLHLSEITAHIIYYIAGFVVHHLKQKIMCEECIATLENDNPTTNNLVYLKSKGGLIHPSSDVVEICSLAEKHFRANFVSKGANGRLISCGKVTKFEVQKACNNIVMKCIGTPIFNSITHHIRDQEFGSNHLINLIRVILIKYFDIRLRYSAKCTSDMIHLKKKRQALTHNILFQGL